MAVRPALALRDRVAIGALLPALCALVFAGLWVTELQGERREAERTVERLELVSLLTDLSFLIEVDRYETLTGVFADAGEVGSLAGPIARIEAVAARFEGELESVLAEIDRRRDHVARYASPADVAWFDALPGELAAASDLLTPGGGVDLADPGDFGERYDEVLDELFVTLDRISADLEDATALPSVSLASHAEVKREMLSEILALASPLFAGDLGPDAVAAVASSASRQDALLASITDLHGPPADPLRTFLTSDENRRWVDIRNAVLASVTGDGSAVPDGLTAIDAAVDRVLAAQQAGAAFASRLLDVSRAGADDTRADHQLAVLVALAAFLLTLLIALWSRQAVGSALDYLRTRARGDEPRTAPPDRAVLDVAQEFEGRVDAAVRTTGARVDVLSRRLRHSEALARSIVDASSDAIFTVDESGAVRDVNPAGVELCGIPPSALVGASLDEILGTTFAEDPTPFEQRPLVVFRPDGSARSVVATAHRVAPVGGDPLITVFVRDETERQELERQLVHEATHDPLTGAFNRASLLTQIGRSQQRLHRYGVGYAVLLFDIGRFKAVNELWGQRGGDLVLQAIAGRLRAHASPVDFVARLGGDQFVVLTEEVIDADGAVALGERLVASATEPVVLHGGSETLTVTCGTVWVDDPTVDPDDVLARAALALERTRRTATSAVGRFEPGLERRAGGREQVQRELRDALERGALHVEIQPMVDLRDGHVRGGELLARWTTPSGEVRSPELFIPMAEESGLIVALDRWVLDKGCQTLAGWRDRGHLGSVRLAFNVSGRNLGGSSVIDDVDVALRRHGIEPSRIVLELTETYLLDDLDVASRTLMRLRRRGIRIAIDDFGTGYSSLAYLRSLPVDEVKIDRSFVAGIEEDRAARSIVAMMTQLATSLGLDVVAEGIENHEQLELLRSMGVRSAQGALFSWPVSPDEFEALATGDFRAVVR